MDRDDATPARARPLSSPTVELGARERTAHADAAPTPPTPPTPFDARDDRFFRNGELGRGGMGWVEDAYDHTLGRSVAIKHLLRGTDRDLARFAREARITARLEHPGIVPVYEAGRDPDGAPYYVMRRVDGKPLADIVDRASFADRLALIPNVLAACDAVAFAHARGIVHRDLKPTNILVGRFGETLVIDWGLAREIGPASGASGDALPIVDDDALTAAGTVAGTPGFMAPEQARGEAIDARADVFALGATLFYVLVGRPIYDSATPTEMVDLAGANRAPDWGAMPARVPSDLRAIVDKALATDPARRYADAAALAADLRRFVTGNLVGAYRYGAVARFTRFVRKHRAAFAIAVASAIALTVLAIVSVRRIVAERDVAEVKQREARDAADDLLVQRALELAQTDPLATIALLRRLDASSSRWRDAWLAAVAAYVRGIPFVLDAGPSPSWVEISGDGKRAAVVSSNRLQICELADHTLRTIAIAAPVFNCHWIGASQLVCLGGNHDVMLVDVDRSTARQLDVHAQLVMADRHSRALIETTDHSIVSITAADPTPHVVMTDAVLAGASPDLAEAAIWHGDALELWTPAGVIPIAQLDAKARQSSTELQIRDHVIAGAIGDEIRRWRIDGDHVVEAGHWPRTDELMIAVVGDELYGASLSDVRMIGTPYPGTKRQPRMTLPTSRGLVTFEDDGTIGVLDRDGWSDLGPYPAHFTRADLSPDGRNLVALTDRGEVFTWDLAASRPRATFLAMNEEPVRLSARAVWTHDSSRGIWRTDLATNARKLVVEAASFRGLAAVSADARWAAMYDDSSAKILVYDATLDTTSSFGGWAAYATNDDGIALATKDGALRWWQPGATSMTMIGALPSQPTTFAIQGHIVIAAFAAAPAARIDLDTGRRVDAELHDTIQDIAFAPDGRAWVATTLGALWRWDREGAPVHVALAEPVEAVFGSEGRTLAATAHALVALDAVPLRVIASEPRVTAVLGSDYAATVSPRGVVSIVDLETGGSVALRAHAITEAIVGNGDSLMFAAALGDHRYRYDTVELRVPHDPAALRAWLSTVAK